MARPLASIAARARASSAARHPPRAPSLPALLACTLIQGCVFLPATIEGYDRECQVVTRHMVLQEVQLAEINHCRNQGCVMLLVAAAATAAATAIVSGSVVVVGNAAYWVEKTANCASAR
jgi:hypothetical protein